MNPHVDREGWLVVPCDAHDHAKVYVDPGDGEWHPGFRDWEGGTRVAKCRPVQQGQVKVRLKVDGLETGFHPVVL